MWFFPELPSGYSMYLKRAGHPSSCVSNRVPVAWQWKLSKMPCLYILIGVKVILASELMLEMSNNTHIARRLNKNQGWRNPRAPCLMLRGLWPGRFSWILLKKGNGIFKDSCKKQLFTYLRKSNIRLKLITQVCKRDTFLLKKTIPWSSSWE